MVDVVASFETPSEVARCSLNGSVSGASANSQSKALSRLLHVLYRCLCGTAGRIQSSKAPLQLA